MKNDTLIRKEGMEALTEKLGLVEAERFITLIRREPFDYTKWQETLYEGMSVEAISAEAAALRAKTESQEKSNAVQPRKPKATKKPSARRKTAKRPAHT